jgi:hypothetical protein
MGRVLGKFDGYSLRELDESDYKQLEEWIAADPAHAGLLDPEFFMGQAVNREGVLAEDPRVTVFALQDRKNTLMYIRLTRASRVQIQFPPSPKPDGSREGFTAMHRHRKQITNALIKGMAFLEVGLAQAGATEWIFETESHSLKLMVERRMGFASSPNEMVRLIPRLDDQEGG